jgi:hypothetical protein
MTWRSEAATLVATGVGDPIEWIAGQPEGCTAEKRFWTVLPFPSICITFPDLPTAICWSPLSPK